MYTKWILYTFLISNVECFTKVGKSHLYRPTKLLLANNDFTDELNTIHNFKYYFQNENYNDVIQNLLDNKISKIFVDNTYRELVTIDNLQKSDYIYSAYSNYHTSNIEPIVLPNLIQKASETHTPIYFVNFNSDMFVNIQNLFSELYNIASFSIPVFIFFSFLSFISNIYSNSKPPSFNSKNINNSNKINNNKQSPFGFLPSFQDKDTEEDTLIKPNVTLKSWAGSPEVIDECREVISYIENKEKYKLIGAEMPKGILLEGPPGTGKTLIAKAIAGETNSTFITMAGSEFVELFVGMGASRVRELFDSARENRPCIIFIDEIDAVGRQRGAGINLSNDEREQTLNQLLYEMDGFNDNEDIVIIAATNRKDVLDQALLRPGRFDRIIKVPLPDKQSREKILDYYLSSKKLEQCFDISAISELTDGFSGAELKNLINEAAILSARNNFTSIQERFIFDAFEKSIVGLIKANATVAPATKLRVAIHESGHTLLALKFKDYFDFQKVSIQPTYNGAGGYTIFTEKPEIKEGGLYTKDILKKRLIIALGGKAAESIYYGNEFVSLGAIQDLKQANSLAKKMIGNFGMGNKLEVFFNEDVDDSSPFLGKSLGTNDRYSEYTKYIMDKESLNLVKEAYNEAKNILLNCTEQLVDFSDLLQNKTVIYKRDL
jgi:cell division protease FtsH